MGIKRKVYNVVSNLRRFEIQNDVRHKMADHFSHYSAFDMSIKWKGMTNRLQYSM